MTTSRIVVRLDAEHGAAELEMMTPHCCPRADGLEQALRQIGMHSINAVELSTPRYRVFRMKVGELDGSQLRVGRVAQVLRLVRDREAPCPAGDCCRAA
jgi:hypothetical protein